MAENTAKAEMAQEIRQVLGTQNAPGQAVAKGTQKTPIMTFNKDHVYLGLKLVSYYDEKTDVQREAVPRITASFNGQFVEMPLDGEWWNAYAAFVNKFAKALDGVKINNETIIDDVDFAQKAMAKFRTAA
ncbi:MAG: hypothetical protein IJ248_06065 [Candidatus Methanomethylophilaceae archaeon]|nr:hypothetical protein [Candidatus Methanomethylophilaceae archaeon]